MLLLFFGFRCFFHLFVTLFKVLTQSLDKPVPNRNRQVIHIKVIPVAVLNQIKYLLMHMKHVLRSQAKKTRPQGAPPFRLQYRNTYTQMIQPFQRLEQEQYSSFLKI